MRKAVLAVLFLVAACGTTYQVPVADLGAGPGPAPVVSRAGGAPRDAGDFRRVAGRVEPVAEAFCREETRGAPPGTCDFRIILETDPRMPPNAFQTRDGQGRPVVVVGARLLSEMTSDSELAFVLSHETAHQIANHIGKQQQQTMLGALILGGIVAATGGPYADQAAADQAVRQAMDVGAFVGSRAYSQSFELEADWLGAFIAERAGYDPVAGAAVFAQPTLASSGGPVLWSTHPPSPRRLALVARASEEIRRQRAAGLTPRPAYAEAGLF